MTCYSEIACAFHTVYICVHPENISSDHISILKVVSTLTIGTVRYMDMGRYRCSADNTETAVVYSQYAELSVIRKLKHLFP